MSGAVQFRARSLRRERPRVNPDRHARIRQKHFHHAALKLHCRLPSSAWADWHYRWTFVKRGYQAAFDACDWGVA